MDFCCFMLFLCCIGLVSNIFWNCLDKAYQEPVSAGHIWFCLLLFWQISVSLFWESLILTPWVAVAAHGCLPSVLGVWEAPQHWDQYSQRHYLHTLKAASVLIMLPEGQNCGYQMLLWNFRVLRLYMKDRLLKNLIPWLTSSSELSNFEWFSVNEICFQPPRTGRIPCLYAHPNLFYPPTACTLSSIRSWRYCCPQLPFQAFPFPEAVAGQTAVPWPVVVYNSQVHGGV